MLTLVLAVLVSGMVGCVGEIGGEGAEENLEVYSGESNLFADPTFSQGFKRHEMGPLQALAERVSPGCFDGFDQPGAVWMFHEVSDNQYMCANPQNPEVDSPASLEYVARHDENLEYSKVFRSDKSGKIQLRFFTEAEKNGGCDLDIDQTTTWPHYGYQQSFAEELRFSDELPAGVENRLTNNYTYTFNADFRVNGVFVDSSLECAPPLKSSWRSIAADHLTLHATFGLQRKDFAPRDGADFIYLTYVLCYAEGGGCNQSHNAYAGGDQFGGWVWFEDHPLAVGQWQQVSVDLRSSLSSLVGEMNRRCTPEPGRSAADCRVNQKWDARTRTCSCGALSVNDFEVDNFHSLLETWGRVGIDYEVKNLSLRRIALANNPVIGFLDGIDSYAGGGWVYDPDHGAAPVQIGVYVDPEHYLIQDAGLDRPGLQEYMPEMLGEQHGFTFLTSQLGLPAGQHTIYVFARDLGGQWTHLSGSPRQVITQ